jgi:hypothetical protein
MPLTPPGIISVHGAGFGIEDALVLATAIKHVDKMARTPGTSATERLQLCSRALSTYNDVRYKRTQWLVSATRYACDLFQAHRVYKPDEDDSAETLHPDFDIADPIDLSSAPRTTAALNPTYVSSRRRRHDAQLAKDRLAFRAHRLTLRNDEFGLNISRLFNAVWDYDIDQMVWDTIAGIDRSQSADDVKDSVEICNDPRDILR